MYKTDRSLLGRFWGKEEDEAAEGRLLTSASVPGCELTRELEDAWNLYTRVSTYVCFYLLPPNKEFLICSTSMFLWKNNQSFGKYIEVICSLL